MSIPIDELDDLEDEIQPMKYAKKNADFIVLSGKLVFWLRRIMTSWGQMESRLFFWEEEK